MSGIYGLYLNKSISRPDSCQLPKLNSAFSHIKPWNMAYGRDCQEEYTNDSNCSLGICYEYITNSPMNSAPLIKKDNYVAVIAAILYNRDELVSIIEDSSSNATAKLDASSISDEELLLYCILKFGGDILAQVNGDFSGAIYDTDKNELMLFRDHIGVRPLFIYSTTNWIAFSSDIRGLIAIPELPARVDEDWLYKAVCGYDTATYSDTEIAGISMVKPSSYLIVKEHNGCLSYDEHIYWTLGQSKIKLPSDKAYHEKMRQLITDSVKRRANVFPGKVGAELSGGLDSGVIGILLSRLGKEGIYYSWSFSPEDLPFAPDDERLVIADICSQEGIACNYGSMTLDLSPDSNVGKSHTALGLVPEDDFPAEYNYALPPYINTTIICETAQFVNKSGGRVIFSGHAGDEGVSHRCDPFELYYHGEYLHYLKHMWHEAKGKKLRPIRTLTGARYNIQIGKKNVTKAFNTGNGAPDILKVSFAEKYKSKPMPPLTFAFDSISYVYSGNTHNRLDVAALLGAYSGARYVFPFVDYRVIDYAVSIPRYLYLNKDENRYIYRQAFKDIMPSSLYSCIAKDNPSNANLKSEPTTKDWFEDFNTNRKKLLSLFNRNMWEDYLDFDYLDKWVSSPRPDDDHVNACINIYKQLISVLNVQMIIERVKAIER